MCLEKNEQSLVASSYFVGFFFGFALFGLPDKIGRKGTMNIVMPLYIIFVYIGVYA